MTNVIQLRDHAKRRSKARRIERDTLAIRMWNRSLLICLTHDELWEHALALSCFIAAAVFFYRVGETFAVCIAAVGSLATFVDTVTSMLCSLAAHRPPEEDPYDDGPPPHAA